MQRVILAALRSRQDGYDLEDYLQEMAALVEAVGGQVVATLVQSRERPDKKRFFGKGKLEELLHLVEEIDPAYLVFDRELSPGQLAYLSKKIPVEIVDRNMLILGIFASRARSFEGKLQVELATLQYQLPRLVGKGQVLSRTGAGIGTRGLGEQQLELDRRQIRRRINDLGGRLAKAEKTRALHRKQRERQGLKTVSLVGYTNAGKSSLFNMLCQKAHSSGQEQAEADERLFQTLDTATRKIRLLQPAHEVLITDTVGFVQDLPHHLIAAFRSTLEEAALADVVLHIVDVADEAYLEKAEVVDQVLTELGARPEQVYLVFNKIDKVGQPELDNGSVLRVSALSGEGVDDLLLFLDRLLWPEGDPYGPEDGLAGNAHQSL